MFDGFENFGLRISEIDGGSLRNAIPRESVATFAVSKNKSGELLEGLKQVVLEIKSEFKTVDANLSIEVNPIDIPNKGMDNKAQSQLLKAIYAAHNGVYRMSPDIEGLVETSNNIARIIVKDGVIKIGCLTRSSSESNKFDLANSLRSAFELAGFNVELSGSYPGWPAHRWHFLFLVFR